jgi:hypothetical protein
MKTALLATALVAAMALPSSAADPNNPYAKGTIEHACHDGNVAACSRASRPIDIATALARRRLFSVICGILLDDTGFVDQQIRQLGNVDGDPPRFIAGHDIGRRPSARLFLIVDVSHRKAVCVFDDEARVVVFLEGSGRREAARALLGVLINPA